MSAVCAMAGAGHNGVQHGGTGRDHHPCLLNRGDCAALSRRRWPLVRQRPGFVDWYVPSVPLSCFSSYCLWVVIPAFWANSRPNKLADVVAFLTCIRNKILIQDGSPITATEAFNGFPQSLEANTEIVPEITARPLPSQFFLIHQPSYHWTLYFHYWESHYVNNSSNENKTKIL